MTDRLSEDALAELRAAMYQSDDDMSVIDPKNPSAPIDRGKGIMSMPALSAEIRRLQKENEEKDRRIKRLEARMRQFEIAMRRHDKMIDDVRYGLDDKMDRFG